MAMRCLHDRPIGHRKKQQISDRRFRADVHFDRALCYRRYLTERILGKEREGLGGAHNFGTEPYSMATHIVFDFTVGFLYYSY